jgi:hypothetical protein
VVEKTLTKEINGNKRKAVPLLWDNWKRAQGDLRNLWGHPSHHRPRLVQGRIVSWNPRGLDRPVATAMVQTGPAVAHAGSRPWWPHAVDLTGMQNLRVMRSWWLTPRCRRKTWEARQKFATGPELMQGGPNGSLGMELWVWIHSGDSKKVQLPGTCHACQGKL